MDDFLKKFKIKDIKPGMIVEYRNGWKALVIENNNELYFISDYGWSKESFYDENTLLIKEKFYSNIMDNDFDIVAIYKHSNCHFSIKDIFNNDNLSIIWTRPNFIRQISKKDIEKAFNINPNEKFEIVD